MKRNSSEIELKPGNFPALVAERIHDAQLRKNLKRATTTSLQKRAGVVLDYDNWEEMRSAAHEIRKEVISHLAEYIEQFECNAARNGTIVHFASDAEEARGIVITICKERDAHHVVKAKSMVSEEIDLRHALEKNGIEAVETDLGEYIVQLANEIPSHITAPAMHKSREEIGTLFSKAFNIPYTSEPEELTLAAREILREKFLRADVGISGINFAIADTGSICIVENEGNARLSTSLPKVHIALMGIEKLVPDLQSLSLFLKMLARSATGQRLTSYTSIIRGPKRTQEPDGPNELHIVIIDNGRTKMLADPKIREALFCIRCGACMNVCPVYQKIGGHSYGSIYSGPIGSILTPMFQGIDESKYLPFASSLCGACAEICPVKIDIHYMLLWLRKSVVDRKSSKLIERFIIRAWMMFMSHKWLYELAGKLAIWLQPLLQNKNGTINVPIWSNSRDFPPAAQHSFRELWERKGEEGL